MRKVLIANRGEIAVRIARACRDAGLESVAVYADPDRDAVHVRACDEAYALGGSTAADSYLVVDKLLDVAAKSGADAVHPGYGFLSENADFAQSVIDAGLTWIGPPPSAIRSLGDKVAARHIAEKAGAPLVAGTSDPVQDSDEVVAFAKENGLPIAIKAAFGGGGRGLKVARELDEVAELYDSAVREAIAAFGRGECFVERYLDNPATWKPKYSRTRTATLWSFPPATARCSVGIRSWWRKPQHRSSPRRKKPSCTEHPKPSSKPPVTSAQERVSSSSGKTEQSHSSR